MDIVNTRAWRVAEVSSTNGHGSARSIAGLYSALATDGTLDGVYLLGPEMVARAARLASPIPTRAWPSATQ
jgi:CubicO group peptidase (beta-lactamase class C family)